MEKGGTFSGNSGGFSLMKEQHDISSNSSEKKNYYMMGMSHHQEKRNDLERPFVGGGGTTVSGGGVGPISCSNSGANEVLGNIYRDDVPFSSSPFLANSTTSPKFEANNTNIISVSTNLQPFHHSGYCSTPFKSPGGMSTGGGGFPFTPAQWEELERQALIYKCMMSSVPVPPHLLFPFSGNFTAPPASTFCTNTRYSKNGDPEPGRCKRTDGKKWRCSRDVAPHQKYCERHLHRGRPRSRKPVEASLKSTSVVGENHKKTRLEQTTTSSAVVSQQQFVQTTVEQPPFMLFNAANNTDLSMSGGPSYKGINRDLSLIVENEMVAMDYAEQQWKNLMVTKMAIANEGSSSYSSYDSSAGVAGYHQDYGNFFPYSAFPPLEIEAPTGFIDAWSMDNLNKVNPESSLSPNNGNLSPSLNLSMAMAAGNVMDGEMSKIQKENGTKDFIDDKTNELSWLSPVSWELFSLGGPLAEALHPGSIPASPYDSMNSNQATNVSSPSGVLHRNMFSNSDGSVCNSPTFAAPPSEIAFQWLN